MPEGMVKLGVVQAGGGVANAAGAIPKEVTSAKAETRRSERSSRGALDFSAVFIILWVLYLVFSYDGPELVLCMD